MPRSVSSLYVFMSATALALAVTSTPAQGDELGLSSAALSARSVGGAGERVILLRAGAQGRVLDRRAMTSASAAGEMRLQVRFDRSPNVTGELDLTAWVAFTPGDRTLALFDLGMKRVSSAGEAAIVRVLRDGVGARESLANIMEGDIESAGVASVPARAALGIVPGRDWAVGCENFVDASGRYGAWGAHIWYNAGPEQDPMLYSNAIGDMAQICPRYASFGANARRAFWVWFAAAVAMKESGCDPRATAQGPNGRLVGLWQLHQGRTDAYAGGRCGKIDGLDPLRNLKCGLDMLDWYTAQPNNSSRLVYWWGNYWQVLHPGQAAQRETHRLVRQYAPCN